VAELSLGDSIQLRLELVMEWEQELVNDSINAQCDMIMMMMLMNL